MKLSHLSIAILSAITLAACGGGGSSQSLTDTDSGVKPVDQTPVDQTPVQPMEPTIPEQEVIVDPAQTGVVGKLDFKTESSVGTTQYIRRADSDFDRVDNPSEETSATSLFGVSVNKQNPYLTNIALARLKDSQYPDMTLVQYLGVDENHPSNYKDPHSLQQQNKHNVVIHSYLTPTLQDADRNSTIAAVDEQIKKIETLIKVYNDKSKDLSLEQKSNLAELLASKKELENFKSAFKKDTKYGANLVAVESTNSNFTAAWGDAIETSSGVLARGPVTTGAVHASGVTGPAAIGLVGINLKADQYSPNSYQTNAKNRIHGTEEKSLSSTRIFGRNFSTDGNKLLSTYNSYQGATTVAENITTFSDDILDPTKFNGTLNAADAYFGYVKNADETNIKWSLAAQPMSLSYVQYGRVTGNLDPVEFTQEEIEAGKKFSYRESEFRTKNSPDSVDTYFYRGPDVTTLEQMNAVAAKGQVLTYRGHALMYGIDNEFHNKTPDAVPTAFGKTDMTGVGNFVEAKVDLSKGRLDDGFVYNVWHDKNASKTIQDALVKFDGNIYGNTVIGEAQRTYNTSDKADFRASFFGPNAEELGGSFNSTTYQERYGANGDVWGGVFGAQRTTGSTLSNQQLGDIAPLTTSPSK